MRTFANITEFINHYEFKKMIPSKTCVIVNGEKHIFDRGGKSKYSMEMKQLDSYGLTEVDYDNGTALQLNVNLVRFFEYKCISEAFFLYKSKGNIEFFCPIYCFDSFTTPDILKNCSPEDIQTFFGMQWVAIEKIPEEFLQMRETAYEEAQKELYYLHLATVEDIKREHKIKNLDRRIKYYFWEDKWDVDRQGNSPYFTEPVKPPKIGPIWY